MSIKFVCVKSVLMFPFCFWKNLKGLLKKFKEERDRIEHETGVRPQIDNTTQMFMQKILNVWISDGKEIDEEKFWIEVDYNRQFTHSVEYYERQK